MRDDARRFGAVPKRLLAILAVVIAAFFPVAASAEVTVELYTRPGCPHCEQARRFLAEEARDRSDLVVVEYDVARDRAALERLRDASVRAGITTAGVPSFVVGGRLLVGFDPATTPQRFRALLGGASGSPEVTGDVCGLEVAECAPPAQPLAAPVTIELPIIGSLSPARLGLPLFTIAVGLVDGFNPCATWVLLFLLAMLINLQDRSKMALIAGTFVVVSGLVYFAFLAAWLTFFVVIGVSRPVRFALAGLSLVVGAVNIKDFFAFHRGPSLSIPESAKPGFYARVRAIVRAENLAGAMLGIVVLAFLVNLVELLCTAGLPAVYTAVLTSRGLPAWQYYGYLSLYIAAYMLDDAVLVTIAVVTLGKRKLQERAGRWLKLVSGLAILALGVVLLVRPGWLGF